MSSITPQEIKAEFLKSKIGIAGIAILSILIFTSIIVVVVIPVDTFKEWNNPGNWISYPKVAIPVWINLFLSEKIPEHKILNTPNVNYDVSGDTSITSHQFGVNFDYGDFPNDFIYEFSAKYSGTPLLQMDVIRPDGIQLKLLSTSLPYSDSNSIHSERIFSTDNTIRKNLYLQSNKFLFSINNLSAEDIIFSKTENHEPLKGNYIFLIKMYSNSENQ